MNAEINDHLQQFDDAVRRAHALTADLDDASVNWREAPEKWSVAQCLDHLSVTARRYAESIEPVVEEARRNGVTGDGPPRRGLLGKLFIRILEPPVKFRAKAPQPFTPRSEISKVDVLDEYDASHRALRALIEKSDGLDLGQVRLASPAASWMKLRLGECYAILTAHERRHLWQVEQILSARK